MHRLRHPVRAIREPFGTAGLIVALVALVAALGGTALAAKGALTGKQKKEVEKIAKKFAGKPGPAGPAGLAGAAGPAGPKGDQGAKGDTGAPGQTGATGEAGICSEANPDCALAPGATLKGMWGTSFFANESSKEEIEEGIIKFASRALISFSVPVSPAPTALYEVEVEESPTSMRHFGVELGDGTTTFFGANPFVDLDAAEAAWKAACPGSTDQPTAEPGYLCIYQGEHNELSFIFNTPDEVEAANEFGIVFPYSGQGVGAWAVTAE